jgi:DNA-binding HxlR family transcriptional regulator
MRIHLMAEANYTPNGELLLPQKQLTQKLKMSPNTVAAGLKELLKAQILEKVREGSRPGKSGQSAGLAAVYQLPHRIGQSVPPWKKHNDPALRGSYRAHSDKLRDLASRLSGNEIKVYLWLNAVHRNEDGSPESNEPRPISAEGVGVSRATLHRVLVALTAKGRIERAQDGIGNQPAYYCLTAKETKGVRASREKKKPTTPLGH